MSSTETGVIFDVQRYSLHDGPGIRSLVFLKGCPLCCQWCSNPESQSTLPEVDFSSESCHRCGACATACDRQAIDSSLPLDPRQRIDRAICDGCGRCAAVCPYGALRMVGRRVTVGEVLNEVLKDAQFYRRSEGGVTLSGGEPLLQAEFARAILCECQAEGLSTAIETTGCASWERLESLLPYLDLVLFDLKHPDPQVHRDLTGVSNELILSNLARLDATGVNFTLRIPVIPECNASPSTVAAMVDIASSLRNLSSVHLLPFHQLGKDKYARLGREYALADLDGLQDRSGGPEELERMRDAFERQGVRVVVGG